jgi:hypothetical protein
MFLRIAGAASLRGETGLAQINEKIMDFQEK